MVVNDKKVKITETLIAPLGYNKATNIYTNGLISIKSGKIQLSVEPEDVVVLHLERTA